MAQLVARGHCHPEIAGLSPTSVNFTLFNPTIIIYNYKNHDWTFTKKRNLMFCFSHEILLNYKVEVNCTIENILEKLLALFGANLHNKNI